MQHPPCPPPLLCFLITLPPCLSPLASFPMYLWTPLSSICNVPRLLLGTEAPIMTPNGKDCSFLFFCLVLHAPCLPPPLCLLPTSLSPLSVICRHHFVLASCIYTAATWTELCSITGGDTHLCALMQQIYQEGLYHPSVTQSITGNLFGSANFSTADVLQQNASMDAGFICTCGEFYDNPCRMEIRAVSTCYPIYEIACHSSVFLKWMAATPRVSCSNNNSC